jgi:tetratricopeptide (TPR) repeat protein
MNRVVYLFGASGGLNYGDDRIAASWVRHYAKHFSDRDIVLDCLEPGAGAVSLVLASARATAVDVLWRAARSSYGEDFRAHFENGLKFPASDRDRRSLAEHFSPTLDAIEILHFHGGGYLNCLWPQTAYALGAAIALKRRTECKLVATGLGLQPATPQAIEVICRALQEFDVAEVRDAQSYAAVKDHDSESKLRLGCDDVFLEPAERPASASRGPRLHICVQREFDFLERLDAAAELVRSLVMSRPGYFSAIRYQMFCPASDGDFLQSLKEQDLPLPIEVGSYADLTRSGLVTAEGDVGLASRFHAHLLLARSQVRGFYLSPLTGYYDVKHHSVVSLGSGWKAAGLNDRPAFEDLSPPAIPDAELQSHKQALASEIILGAAPGTSGQPKWRRQLVEGLANGPTGLVSAVPGTQSDSVQRAREFLTEGQLLLARAELRQAPDGALGNAGTWLALAQAAERVGAPDLAHEAFGEARRWGEDPISCWLGQAHADLALLRLDDALTTALRALQLSPAHPQALAIRQATERAIVQKLTLEGNYNKALQLLLDMRSRYDADPEVHFRIGECLFSLQGDLEEAVAALDAAERLEFPQKFWIFFFRGASKFCLGDGAGASNDLKAALALDPSHVETMKMLESLSADERKRALSRRAE